MDRREALKKIGVGGVTILGASSIISSSAFAYGSPPVPPAAPIVNISGTTTYAQFFFPFLDGPTCPGTSGGAPGYEVGTEVFTFSNTSAIAGGAQTAPGVFSLTLPSGAFAIDDTAHIEIPITFNCSYVGGDSFLCVRYVYDFIYNGVLFTLVGGAPTIAAC